MCWFIAVLIKILTGFFEEVDKLILKFMQKLKGPRMAKTSLKKNNRIGELILPDTIVHYKTKQSSDREIVSKK